MKSIKLLMAFVCLFFTANFVKANNLQISNIQVNNGGFDLTFDVSWDNSWNLSNNVKDGVWIFIKYREVGGTQWRHANIPSAGTANSAAVAANQSLGQGIFLTRRAIGTGNIPTTQVNVNFLNLVGAEWDFKVFGIEMVKVPQGEFYVGDATGTTNSGSAQRYSTTNNMPYLINSTNHFQSINDMTHVDTTNSGLGLTVGTIASLFPKGYTSFWCMKYEITKKQYVDFLNTLNRTQQNTRTTVDVSPTTIANHFVMNNSSSRQVIACDAVQPAGAPIEFYCDLNNNNTGNEADDGLEIACHHLSAEDVFAYLDWATLRPLSAFEWEKAARGIELPQPGQYAWGTTQRTPEGNLLNIGTSSETLSNIGSEGLANSTNLYGPLRVGIQAGSNTTRSQAGASYYGAMNMSDNIGEWVIFAEGNTTYEGTIGDGDLDINGNHTNTDWKQNNNNEIGAKNGTISQTFDQRPMDFRWHAFGGRGCRIE